MLGKGKEGKGRGRDLHRPSDSAPVWLIVDVHASAFILYMNALHTDGAVYHAITFNSPTDSKVQTPFGPSARCCGIIAATATYRYASDVLPLTTHGDTSQTRDMPMGGTREGGRAGRRGPLGLATLSGSK